MTIPRGIFEKEPLLPIVIILHTGSLSSGIFPKTEPNKSPNTQAIKRPPK